MGYGETSSQIRILPAGSYVPFFIARKAGRVGDSEPLRKATDVAAFELDIAPITNQRFLEFVRKNREWSRSRIAAVFADESYLKHWRSDYSLKRRAERDQPVTHVSWFAAAAYCHSQGKELPTTDQWEYAAKDAGRHADEIVKQNLSWYGSPNPQSLAPIKQQAPNGYGIYDFYGLVWEWTLDFNSSMIGSELRGDGTKDDNLFCGAGSLNALDSTDYANFMRYSFRSSLRANYTTANLGFRCARGGEK